MVSFLNPSTMHTDKIITAVLRAMLMTEILTMGLDNARSGF